MTAPLALKQTGSAVRLPHGVPLTVMSRSSVVWSDIEFPKISRDVYSDKFRIQSFSCLFELSPETHLQALTAVQLVFESLENPDLIIAAPLNGVKARGVAWSYQLFLQPTETIVGMKHGYLSSDLIVKTSLGRVLPSL